LEKFILLTTKDPWLQPSGGTSAFARHLLSAFKNEIAVVSMTSEDLPIGEWIKREFDNVEIRYLCLGKRDFKKKSIIPVRLHFLFILLKKAKLLNVNEIRNLYVDTPEAVFALSNNWESICYMFHGLSNPIANGRYKLFQWFGFIFEKIFLRKLVKISPNCFLAAADNETISDFYLKTNFNLKIGRIIPFPTRVDQNIFFPINNVNFLRRELNINKNNVFTVVGRLAWIKGWDLILDAFKLYYEKYSDSLLVFVGEGEDRERIQKKIIQLKLNGNVIITGLLPPNKVAEYINISDICLVGSFYEGWSVAMCEMLACGKRIVTTNVSGAHEMVQNGRNGFIVNDRTPADFFIAIENTMDNIPSSNNISLELSKKYLLRDLKHDLEYYWRIK
jgi:glycosyltransferase involved in cell wall biosynthesis